MTTTAYYHLTDEVVQAHGATCHLCQHPIDLTIRNGPGSLQVDHVWPQSRGGCHHLDNLRPSHRRCNGSRGNRLITRHPICPCTEEARRAQRDAHRAAKDAARAQREAAFAAELEAWGTALGVKLRAWQAEWTVFLTACAVRLAAWRAQEAERQARYEEWVREQHLL